MSAIETVIDAAWERRNELVSTEIEQQLRPAVEAALDLLESGNARVAEPQPSPPSPVDPELFAHIAGAAKNLWSEIPVSPYMSAGATDSVFLRAAGMPVYVFNGIAYDVDDDRAHGQDERMRVDSYYQSLQFNYRLLQAL